MISALLSAGAPLLMALIATKWPYWYDAFFAQVCLHESRLPLKHLTDTTRSYYTSVLTVGLSELLGNPLSCPGD